MLACSPKRAKEKLIDAAQHYFFVYLNSTECRMQCEIYLIYIKKASFKGKNDDRKIQPATTRMRERNSEALLLNEMN
jgi:hypothetical protein